MFDYKTKQCTLEELPSEIKQLGKDDCQVLACFPSEYQTRPTGNSSVSAGAVPQTTIATQITVVYRA